jgi:phenylacetate-CoA ligase
MANSGLQALYDNSPLWLQTIYLNLYALKIHRQRYGSDFEALFEEFRKTEQYTLQQIRDYQDEKVAHLIRYATTNVPYYRQLFRENKLKASDVQNVNDLHKVPVLTKDMVKRHAGDLLATNIGKDRLIGGSTSGTTGSPLQIYYDQNICLVNNVVDWRQKAWAGIDYGDRIALILGRPIVGMQRKKPPFWQYDFIHKQLWMSAFHMSPANLGSYVDKLGSFSPKAIEGYPSTMHVLAKFILEQGIRFPLKAVFVSSEPLLDIQREEIEAAFQCRVFDFYGLAERVIFASQCQFHEGLHLNFEYGILEIVDENCQALDAGEEGAMVATGLQNYAMPLIRYQISDRTSKYTEQCACGRELERIRRIETKQEDTVVRTDGTKISPSVLTHPFKSLKNIEKSQVVQESSNQITVRLVRLEQFKESDLDTFKREFSKRVGTEFHVKIEFVDDIAREKSGKYRWVIRKCGDAKHSVPVNDKTDAI